MTFIDDQAVAALRGAATANHGGTARCIDRPGPSRRAGLMRAVHCADAWAPPPLTGWRSVARHLGARNLGPGRREQIRESWRQLIRRQLGSPKIIAVFSPAGGVGKTTTAVHLGHALALVRGDLVTALDANPHSGNLVKRVSEPHSALGAGELHRAAESLLRCTDLLPYVTRAESGLWVVRSGPDTGARLGADEYRHILQVLGRYSSLIVVDLGTGMREPGFLAIAEAADALVAVAAPQDEGAEAAVDAIDRVNQRFPDRNRASTIVINAVRAKSRGLDFGELAAGSELYVDQVLRVPHDPHLATGGASRWALLSGQTRDAYLQTAATIITLLHEQGHPAPESPPAPLPGLQLAWQAPRKGQSREGLDYS